MIGNPPSLAAFFANWRRNKGEFLRYEGDLGASRLSYPEAANGAEAFSQHLRLSGIQKGDRIVFWGENRPEWVVALWGCLLSGVVAVPVDFRSSAAMTQRIAGIVEARALLLGDDLEAPAGITCPVWPMRSILLHPRASHADAPATPDQLAEVLFTSGATGDPKGVTITHRNILANLKPIAHGIEKYRRYMGPFRPIRFLNLLPLSHMFGQSMAAFIPPMIAGDVYFTSGFTPRDIVRLIHRRRISVLVCVPQMLELLQAYILHAVPQAAQPRRGSKWYAGWWQYRAVHQLFGWKFWSFVVGAAPLDPDLEEFWRKLGYVVIQGYGLTETAPVATLNHPMETRKGSVGKAISGVEIRIAADGEILLRGENVTPGYYGEDNSAILDSAGWLHTGDIGELDDTKNLHILGRRKEMIVSSSGLNVFPEDVERVLNALDGVRESAVVAKKQGAGELVHAVLVLDPEADPAALIDAANARLEAHQGIRGYSVWPQPSLPRTSGTNKLKRMEIASWVAGEGLAASEPAPARSLDDPGLSSLDRIQVMMEIEHRTGVPMEITAAPQQSIDKPLEFPAWNRSLAARLLRRLVLPTLILPLTRLFAWIKVDGAHTLRGFEGPVVFASNHQSHFDVPAIFKAMPQGWRYRTAPAMAKEFFDGHFHPERHTTFERFTSSLNYYLSCLVFNAFPLPQREAGTREAIRYAGELTADGYSILIFPEGKRTDAGEILPFQPGAALLASRLRIPVIPIRVEGLDRVLHKSARFATPGNARVIFGPPITLEGSDYVSLTRQVEEAVRRLN
ncbi:MAG: AMP-binding protein [Acidobacteriota bacterium]|nr:AMP-binding protein [Acidobacteriota bacterium]